MSKTRKTDPARKALVKQVNKLIDDAYAGASIQEVHDKPVTVAVWGIRDDPDVVVAVMGYWDVLEGEDDDEYVVEDDTLLELMNALKQIPGVAVVNEGSMKIDEQRGQFYSSSS